MRGHMRVMHAVARRGGYASLQVGVCVCARTGVFVRVHVRVRIVCVRECVCARICVCAVSVYLQNWLEMLNSRDAQLTFYYFHIFLWGEGVSVNDVYSRMHA